MLLRVLYFVSAQDLASLARVSRLLQQYATEPVLWRRLYCARWGNRRLPRVHTGWKVRQQQHLLLLLLLWDTPDTRPGVTPFPAM
jgi:hypothetical protein